MVSHPATQALCAAPETQRPHATAASAVESLLFVLLRSLLVALLGTASATNGAVLRIRSLRHLVAVLARLQSRQEAREAEGWIPRCQRQQVGEVQILLALLYGRKPRPRALPAAMPPARPRIARAPPRVLPA